MTLADLSIKQLNRLFFQLWYRMIAGDGYQPFGYDRTTLWATHPTYMKHLTAVNEEMARKKAQERSGAESAFMPGIGEA